MAMLESAGGRAWFVGGCVRDSLLRTQARPTVDIDIATDLLPARVREAAAAKSIKTVPTGIEHGTITVVLGDHRFEVTTLRTDVLTDGRHAQVEFGTDLTKDAARRDFTINALYATADGRLVDPLGGLADLRARRVRFVGDPDRRIGEDHLRILRFFRFNARFGGDRPDPDGLAACIRQRDRLASLSAERIARELLELVLAEHAVAALEAMTEGGITAALGLADAEPRCLQYLLDLDQPADALLRLAALFRCKMPSPGRGQALGERLKLSSAQQSRLEAMLGLPLPSLDEPDAARHRTWYRDGSTGPWRDRFLLAAAIARNGSTRYAAALTDAATWQRPDLPIGGMDVLSLGVSPGVRVGALLREVEEWWLDQGMRPDRQACLAQLATRYRLDEAGHST